MVQDPLDTPPATEESPSFLGTRLARWGVALTVMVGTIWGAVSLWKSSERREEQRRQEPPVARAPADDGRQPDAAQQQADKLLAEQEAAKTAAEEKAAADAAAAKKAAEAAADAEKAKQDAAAKAAAAKAPPPPTPDELRKEYKILGDLNELLEWDAKLIRVQANRAITTGAQQLLQSRLQATLGFISGFASFGDRGDQRRAQWLQQRIQTFNAAEAYINFRINNIGIINDRDDALEKNSDARQAVKERRREIRQLLRDGPDAGEMDAGEDISVPRTKRGVSALGVADGVPKINDVGVPVIVSILPTDEVETIVGGRSEKKRAFTGNELEVRNSGETVIEVLDDKPLTINATRNGTIAIDLPTLVALERKEPVNITGAGLIKAHIPPGMEIDVLESDKGLGVGIAFNGQELIRFDVATPRVVVGQETNLKGRHDLDRVQPKVTTSQEKPESHTDRVQNSRQTPQSNGRQP